MHELFDKYFRHQAKARISFSLSLSLFYLVVINRRSLIIVSIPAVSARYLILRYYMGDAVPEVLQVLAP